MSLQNDFHGQCTIMCDSLNAEKNVTPETINLHHRRLRTAQSYIINSRVIELSNTFTCTAINNHVAIHVLISVRNFKFHFSKNEATPIDRWYIRETKT